MEVSPGDYLTVVKGKAYMVVKEVSCVSCRGIDPVNWLSNNFLCTSK